MLGFIFSKSFKFKFSTIMLIMLNKKSWLNDFFSVALGLKTLVNARVAWIFNHWRHSCFYIRKIFSSSSLVIDQFPGEFSWWKTSEKGMILSAFLWKWQKCKIARSKRVVLGVVFKCQGNIGEASVALWRLSF